MGTRWGKLRRGLGGEYFGHYKHYAKCWGRAYIGLSVGLNNLTILDRIRTNRIHPQSFLNGNTSRFSRFGQYLRYLKIKLIF